ncbi:hypothetical protein BGZ94_001325 [Podila epigama]|nr:hypothetical protein BGZ94_001325 [Podila epigama]
MTAEDRSVRFRFTKDDEILLLRLVLRDPCPYSITSRDGTIMQAWNKVTQDFSEQCTRRNNGNLPMSKTCRARCDKLLSDYLELRSNPSRDKYKIVSKEDIIKRQLASQLAYMTGKIPKPEDPIYLSGAVNDSSSSSSSNSSAVDQVTTTDSDSAHNQEEAGLITGQQQHRQEQDEVQPSPSSSALPLSSQTMVNSNGTKSTYRGALKEAAQVPAAKVKRTTTTTTRPKRKSISAEMDLMDRRMSAPPKKPRQVQRPLANTRNLSIHDSPSSLQNKGISSITSSSSSSSKVSAVTSTGLSGLNMVSGVMDGDRGDEESDSDEMDDDDDDDDEGAVHITTGFDDVDDSYEHYAGPSDVGRNHDHGHDYPSNQNLGSGHGGGLGVGSSNHQSMSSGYSRRTSWGQTDSAPSRGNGVGGNINHNDMSSGISLKGTSHHNRQLHRHQQQQHHHQQHQQQHQPQRLSSEPYSHQHSQTPGSPPFSATKGHVNPFSRTDSIGKGVSGGLLLSQMSAEDREYTLRTLALEENKIKVEIDRIALERERLALERARLQWEMSGK